MNIKRLIPDRCKQEFKIKLGAPHMYWSITNMKRNGFSPRTILDIGAYQAEWSIEVEKIFPEAHFFLFEANPEKEKLLKDICNSRSNFELEMGLLARESGRSTTFNILDVGSSALEEINETDGKKVSLVSRRLDKVLRDRSVKHVDFIKLDVQGYELEILKGAEEFLCDYEAILCEVSLIALHKDCPVMADVINYMDKFNYCAYDICSVAARRPYDRALWQTDIIFVKKDSKLLSLKRYF